MRATFSAFARATTSIKLPHKYIFTTSKPDLSAQLDYITYKQGKTDNDFFKHLLAREHSRFQYFSQNREDRQDYMLVTGDIESKELQRAVARFIDRLGTITGVSLCTPLEAMNVLRRCLTLSPTASDRPVQTLTDILPSSISVRDNHFIVDGQYITSLIIKSFPSFVSDFQLANLICNRYDDCLITMDVEENSKQSVVKQVKNSVNELSGRANVKYQRTTDHLDNASDYQVMSELYNNLVNGYEQIISVTYRIYVRADTLEAMQTRLKDIVNDLAEFSMQGFVRVNEQLEEYKALVTPSNYIQTSLPLHDTYKKQFPFYDECLIDNQGIYLGESQSGGIVAIDFFNRTSGRESYDMIAFGTKGSGKTIFLKSMIQKQIMQGNKVFTIDIENEYGTLCKVLSGTNISFNRYSSINPLQIRNAVVSSVDDDETETNFESELSRILTFLHIYAPSLSADSIELMRTSLIELYRRYDITEHTDISSLTATDFPTFKELSALLSSNLYEADGQTFRKNYAQSDLEAYRELIRVCNALSSQTMFGSHTNVNYEDSQFVVFNVKALSEMNDNIFNAQLFNIISIMWSEVCKNVLKNTPNSPMRDRVRVVCIADEAHRFLNSNNPIVLSFFEKLLRRSRKYDAGLWFATQSILDINPEGTDAGFNVLRTLFSNIQYKVILKQQSNCFKHLQSTFYQLTESEVTSTADFTSGQMIILLGAGRHKIHCECHVDKGDLLYLGNSQDVQELVKGIYESLYSDYDITEVQQELSQDSEYFKLAFRNEVYDEIGLEPSISPDIDEIIVSAIDSLVVTLLQGGVSR